MVDAGTACDRWSYARGSPKGFPHFGKSRLFAPIFAGAHATRKKIWPCVENGPNGSTVDAPSVPISDPRLSGKREGEARLPDAPGMDATDRHFGRRQGGDRRGQIEIQDRIGRAADGAVLNEPRDKTRFAVQRVRQDSDPRHLPGHRAGAMKSARVERHIDPQSVRGPLRAVRRIARIADQRVPVGPARERVARRSSADGWICDGSAPSALLLRNR